MRVFVSVRIRVRAPLTPKLQTPKFEFELASGLESGCTLRLGFMYPHPKILHPQFRVRGRVTLKVRVSVKVRVHVPLTPKLRTPKFEFKLASDLGSG